MPTKTVNLEDVVDENIPASIIPNLMESVGKYLTASSRVIGHTERVLKSKVVKGVKKSKDFYQVRLSGNPAYNLKVTRKPGLSIPETVTNPTWEMIVGYTDGTTQAKEAKAKETKEEAKELADYNDSVKFNRYAFKPRIKKYDYIQTENFDLR